MKSFIGMIVVMSALLLAACQPIPQFVESDSSQIELDDLATALAILDDEEKNTKEYELLIRFFFSCLDGALFDTYESDTFNEMTDSQQDALKYFYLGVFVSASAQFDATATADGEHESSVGIGQDGAPFADQIEAATEMCNRVLDETGQ